MTFKFKMKRKIARKPKVKKQEVNWLKLPSDVMANILYRVGVIDILENAQKVCTAWRNICKDPSMWKVISIHQGWDPCEKPPAQEMCKHAVDRSQGQLVDLSLVDICSYDVLMYIAERSPKLRRLEILYCYGDLYDGFPDALKSFPLLEELSLHTTDISEEDIKGIARCCPLLKTLKVNNRPHEFLYDDVALAIGKNFPELRNLELIGNSMSNIGLRAILDGCGKVESLDLRQCFHIDLKGGLGKRLSKQIKNLKLPKDPLDKKKRGVSIEPRIHRKRYDEESDESWDDDDDDDYDFTRCFGSSDDDFDYSNYVVHWEDEADFHDFLSF